MPVTISKSTFIAGVQCLKRLYLLVHRPELEDPQDGPGETIVEQGREVGVLARKLFPGGIEVDGSAGLKQAIRTTRQIIANPEIPAIFEGAFEHEGIIIKTDILQRRKGNVWRLVEVKSASDLKDHHIEDVAIQSYVLSRSGLKVASVWLAHINRAYALTGTTVDPRQLFSFRNLTQRAQNFQPELILRLRSQFHVLKGPEVPDVPTGQHCVNPVICEFFNHCNTPKPHDHIGYLPRLGASAMGKLEEMGVQFIQEIPADFELSEIQRRACTAIQTGQPWFSPDLKREFEALKYPLYFMDFETVNPAIPRLSGMRPYDHLPFQWSVHVQAQPGAEPEHYEFLATDSSDPRPAFISQLCDVLGDRGSIVVYHQQFESQRLSDLASWLPEFSSRIEKIQRRLWDLLPIIRDHVYHPAFAGSYSLKSVLPALVPEMTYEGMEVGNGQAAGLVWESLIGGSCGEVERQRKRKALLDYCGQDTLGMVRLVEKLRHVSE